MKCYSNSVNGFIVAAVIEKLGVLRKQNKGKINSIWRYNNGY